MLLLIGNGVLIFKCCVILVELRCVLGVEMCVWRMGGYSQGRVGVINGAGAWRRAFSREEALRKVQLSSRSK